jgi:hypothetical protein
MSDWELWYALMEDERKTWPIYQVGVSVDELERLRLAAEAVGVRTTEFIELAVRERLARPAAEWWEEFYAIRNEYGPEPCFFCGDLTEFVDLTFEAPFCNSGICNWAINEDLRMATA